MEHVHLLNDDGTLCGIYSEANDADRPAVIMINAGLLHHIGPQRVYTQLARQLNAQGFNSLRFDLSNIGDSLSGQEHDIDAQTRHDIRSAMDFLERRYQSRRFIVLGICSGADDAFAIAVNDPRIVGAYIIDGHGYRTRRYYLNHFVLHYGRRLLSAQKWQLILRRLRQRGSTDAAGEAGTPSSELADGIRPGLPYARVADEMAALLQRDCQLRFVYTGGVSDYYNYHGQFEDSFPQFRDNAHVDAVWFPDSDHLFMLQAHRDALIADTVAWLNKHF